MQWNVSVADILIFSLHLLKSRVQNIFLVPVIMGYLEPLELGRNIYLLKSTIEALKKVQNMFKVSNKNTTTTSFWCYYCYFWTYFTFFLMVFLLLTLNK